MEIKQKRKRKSDLINDTTWIGHINHLQSGMMYQRDCKICNIKINIKYAVGLKTNKEMLKNIISYNNAIENKHKSISIKEWK